MIANRNFEECQPLTWVGRFPVYLSTAMAAALALSMALTALAMALVLPLSLLAFSRADFIGRFFLWQPATYWLVNPPGFFFALNLVFFAIFGRDVEKFIGRGSFVWLAVLLVLAAPVFLTAVSFFVPVTAYFGAGGFCFAVFIAFVIIYPRAELFFGVEARWWAAGLLAVNSLIFISGRAWVELELMWWQSFVAAAWLYFEGVRPIELPALPAFRLPVGKKRSNFKVVRSEPEEDSSVADSIDPILDKIARQGIGSLTKAERDQLERARTALLAKEGRR